MIKGKLMDWMPGYYKGKNARAIQEARDAEMQSLQNSQDRVYGDMYVSTAEDISLWEDEYGLKASATDIKQRQQNMLAYIRGNGGAVTKPMIEALVTSYIGDGTVEVIEESDNSIIRLKCEMISTSYFDPEGMIKTLLERIQAHVGVVVDAIWNYEAETDIHLGFECRGEYIVDTTIKT